MISLQKLKDSYNGGDLLIKEGIVQLNRKIKVLCKNCGAKYPQEDIKYEDKEFWRCTQCTRKQKYSLKYVVTEEFLVFNNDILKRLNESILNKLKTLGYTAESFQPGIVIFDFGGVKFPIQILDFSFSSSILAESLEKKTIILYFDEEVKNDIASIYTSPKFIRFPEFLRMDRESFDELGKYLQTEDPTLRTIDNIRDLNRFMDTHDWRDFENATSKLFSSFNKKSSELKQMLSYLKKNQNNPQGAKFIKLGGNHPADFYAIQLFDYIQGVLSINDNKYYDAKMYEQNLTYNSFSEKTRTNPGSQLVFITNSKNIPSRIWADILKAKERNGAWYYLIVDFDLICLFLYFVGNDFYK